MYDPYRQQNQNQHPQLFEDTSTGGYGYQGYNQPPMGNQPQMGNQAMPSQINPTQSQMYPPLPGASIVNDPLVANMAMQYGQSLVGQGRSYVDEKIGSYMNVSKVKYYFAVDTKYVMQKIRLLFFPFMHSDWGISYAHEDGEPVQPRYDINAPDLYIPLMAFVTYILVAGFCLGLQERFSPDVLGLHASWTVAWLFIEILLGVISLHVTSTQTQMQTLHLLALASYKYVGMVTSLIACIILDTTGYYIALAYCAFSLSVFLFRTLRSQLGSSQNMAHSYSTGTKRRLYLMLLMVGVQPVVMWWLTRHLCFSPSRNVP